MAEYYPLLAKAIASLPDPTLDKRRIVYDRARKALIGQLRTLHPPVPEEDIERESNELDRAVERLEGEIASRPLAVAEAGPTATEARAVAAPVAGPARPLPPANPAVGALGPVERRPLPPLRTKVPVPRAAPVAPAGAAPAAVPEVGAPASSPAVASPAVTSPAVTSPIVREPAATGPAAATAAEPPGAAAPPAVPSAAAAPEAASADPDAPKGFTLPGGRGARQRAGGRRPFAPQPAATTGARRPLWIIPAVIGALVLIVGVAAYQLRDSPQAVVRATTGDQQAQTASGKIAERVGGSAAGTADTAPAGGQPATSPPAAGTPSTGQPAAKPSATGGAASQSAATDGTAAPANPELPVAHRAALLVEAPEEANKIRTYLGTTVWKLNNVSGGPNEPVGLAVEADIDLPDDKMKAVVTFEKNTDASLPASHTIKVRFLVQPGSPTGDIKQINVPQLRREDSPTGEGLAGVTVSVIPNSFLVGLSPGAAEASNLELMRSLQWIDIPMLMASGKIAKLTFEKGDSGQRDLAEAITAWQK